MKKTLSVIIAVLCIFSLFSCSAVNETDKNGGHKKGFDYPVSGVGESVIGDETYRFRMNIDSQSSARLEITEPEEIAGAMIVFDGDNTTLCISGAEIPISSEAADSVREFIRPFMLGENGDISTKADRASGTVRFSDEKNEYILSEKDESSAELLIKHPDGNEAKVIISDYSCGTK